MTTSLQPHAHHPRKSPLTLLLTLLLLLLLPLWAAAQCPDGSTPPDEPIAIHAHRLAELAPQCSQNPAYLAWRGAVLLALGQPEEAVALLEQALLLAPTT